MHKFEQFYLENKTSVNYVNVTYPDNDKTDIVTLFIHGFTSKAIEKNYLFRHISRALTARLDFTTIIFDLSGHGDSTGELESITFQRWINEIINVFEYIEGMAPKEVHIISTGFGNVLATEFCSRFPGKVESLTMISPSNTYQLDENSVDLCKNYIRLDEALDTTTQLRSDTFWGYEQVHKNKILHDWLLRMGAIDFDSIVEVISSRFVKEVNHYPFLDKIKKIKINIHLITGEHSSWIKGFEKNSRITFTYIANAMNDVHNKPEWQQDTIKSIQKYYSEYLEVK